MSISELGRFYYLPGFHDMRCKYGRVLSVIRQQMNREPQAGEVYIMMSKDLQTVRLYGYERHSCNGASLRLRAALVQPLREAF